MAVFDSEISNLIERRTLLLPQGSVGQLVGGQPIIRQDATGAVFTSLSSSAVFVRTNALKVRLRGVEGSVAMKLRQRSRAQRQCFLRARQRSAAPALPPNLENGIPPLPDSPASSGNVPDHPRGSSSTQISRRRNVASPITIFHRHASAELRTREEIAGFFNGGAVARGLVRNGILLRDRRNAGAGAAARAWTRTAAQPVVHKESRICVVEPARRFPHRRAFVDHSHSRKHSRQELPHDGLRYRWSRNKCGGPVLIQFLKPTDLREIITARVTQKAVRSR